MIIPLDRDKKLILLRWLQKKVIDTEDMKELNEVRDRWFSDLIKRRTDKSVK